jgi:hypothetical protein
MNFKLQKGIIQVLQAVEDFQIYPKYHLKTSAFRPSMISILLCVMEIRVHTSLSLPAVLVKALCHFPLALRFRSGLIVTTTYARRYPAALSSVLLYVRNKLRTAERIFMKCYVEDLD